MPSSEDYTVVWAGVYLRLKAKQASQACRGTHPLIKSARKVGLDFWYDSFQTDPVEGSISCLLIGRHLATLGYKEGETKYQLSAKKSAKILAETERKLSRMKVYVAPKLYVLVHIQDVD